MKNMHLVIAVAAAMALSAMPVETYAQLLAGTAGSPNLGPGGVVYAYQGGTNWLAISPSLGYAVLDIINFNGTLFAATESDLDSNYGTGSGAVWRYNGGASWSVVESNMDNAVCSLAIYQGQLYAGTMNLLSENPEGNLYRYNGTKFDLVGTVTNFHGIRSMYSSSYGYLQLGDVFKDVFGHYDGTNLYYDTNFDDSCVLAFAEYNNELYAATEEPAILFGSTNGTTWSAVTNCPTTNYALWQLEPFQGQLYLGYGTNCTDDNGEAGGQLAYMDSSQTWHSVLTVSDSINSMAAEGDTMLYFGTGYEVLGSTWPGIETGSGPGHVYAYAGNGATGATLISGIMGAGVQCLYHPASSCVEAPTNLVLWLPFDETSGTISANLAAPEYPGTQVGNPTPIPYAYVANSLSFNGVNQYVTVPDYPAIEIGTNDFTIDAWVQCPTNTDNVYTIVDKRTISGSVEYGYIFDAYYGNLLIQLDAGRFAGNNVDTTNLPADGGWHFVAVSVHRTSTNGIQFYIDGQPTSTSDPTDHESSLSNNASLQVGGSTLAGTYWLGGIDEVEVYNRALSTNELYAIYSAGTAGKCKPCCYLKVLTISKVTSTTVEVNWGGCGTLEQSTNLLGPWIEIPNAASPYVIPIMVSKTFYRLECP